MARVDMAVSQGLKIGPGVVSIVAGAILLGYTAQILLLFFAAIFLSVFFSSVGSFLQKHTRFTYPTCVAFGLMGLLQRLVLACLG